MDIENYTSSVHTLMRYNHPPTAAHCYRVGLMSERAGKHMGLSDDDRHQLKYAGWLHDIGKIGCPNSILYSPQRLTPEEYIQIQKHVQMGVNALLSLHTEESRMLADVIQFHHERWDGGGYPRQTLRDDAPLLSRVITITDSMDAMSRDFCGRLRMTAESVVAEVKKCSGTQFDPHIVRQLDLDDLLKVAGDVL